MEIFPRDIGQFICGKDLMKNFKGASALQRKLICESLCSLCCPECIWGEEEEPVPCSYCQVYHMWVSQDINIPRQLTALEQAVFRWSPLVWTSPGQFEKEAACPQSPRGPALSKFSALNGILWSCISPDTAPPTRASLLKVSASFLITKWPCCIFLSFSVWIPADTKPHTHMIMVNKG